MFYFKELQSLTLNIHITSNVSIKDKTSKTSFLGYWEFGFFGPRGGPGAAPRGISARAPGRDTGVRRKRRFGGCGGLLINVFFGQLFVRPLAQLPEKKTRNFPKIPPRRTFPAQKPPFSPPPGGAEFGDFRGRRGGDFRGPGRRFSGAENRGFWGLA